MTRRRWTYREIAYITAQQRGMWNNTPQILCGECGLPLLNYSTIELDHNDAIGFGEGRDVIENMRFLCGICHRIKTAADKRRMAKADRQAGRTGQRARRDRRGSRIKSGPMPGTKASGIRKRMDGTVERRT